MKKRNFLFISVMLIVMSATIMAACSPKLMQNTKLSELRSNVYVGQKDGYKVTAATGVREMPFKIDGVSQAEKAYFTIITVQPDTIMPTSDYFFEITIASKKYQGKMVMHPFNNTMSIEIECQAEEEFLELSLTNGDDTSTLRLDSVKQDDFIDADKAYQIAFDKLKKSVEEKSKDKDYEIFVRLIEPVDSSLIYHWYIAFVFEDETTYAVLIDPISMEIKAIKD